MSCSLVSRAWRDWGAGECWQALHSMLGHQQPRPAIGAVPLCWLLCVHAGFRQAAACRLPTWMRSTRCSSACLQPGCLAGCFDCVLSATFARNRPLAAATPHPAALQLPRSSADRACAAAAALQRVQPGGGYSQGRPQLWARRPHLHALHRLKLLAAPLASRDRACALHARHNGRARATCP